MTEKLFALSVADALLIDPQSDTLVVKGNALLSSTMEQTMQEQEVFAGRGSQLQFTYNYQKVLSFQIEAADFSPTYLALQTGSKIKNEMSKYYIEETVTFDDTGKGTLSDKPIGGVYVEMASNHNTINANGKSITVPTLANKTAKVVYQYNVLVDKLTIPANSFPKAYKLVLTSDIFGAEGDKVFEQQIIAPRYKLDGALSMNLTHDGVSQFTLNGKTLADDDNNYAYITWKPVGNTKVAISMLAVNIGETTLAVGETETVTVYGIRGGEYSNIVMDNSALTFTSDDESVATFVDGVITGVAVGETNVKVSDGTNTDVIEVVVA
ncbi:hypothetical protein [Lysinibacillus sp. NPDC086135]|uniref:hypothetical protein n=1 Tax=Lysinibacillus sp. NPDC086135 TaxID=3364130 RepID=UPI00380B31E2